MVKRARHEIERQVLRLLVCTVAAAISGSLGVVACSAAAGPEAATTVGPPAVGGEGSSAVARDARPNDAVAEATVDADADASSEPCLGDTLAPEDGGGAADGGIDCGMSATCAPMCERIVSRYRAGVAQEAARCIRALPSCTGALDVIPCVDLALARACASPSALAYCDPLRAACVDGDGDAAAGEAVLSKTGCETFASGLSSVGRTVFAACISSATPDAGCPAGAVVCADEIRQ